MLTQIFDELFAAYGPQHWWPGNSPFEVMVGAILTQNTAWTNVEKAIANLKQQRYLAPQHILAIGEAALADCIRPAGYFNVKPRFSISTLLRPHNALNLREKGRKTVCHRRVTTPPTVFLPFSPIFSTLRTLATRLMENLG